MTFKKLPYLQSPEPDAAGGAAAPGATPAADAAAAPAAVVPPNTDGQQPASSPGKDAQPAASSPAAGAPAAEKPPEPTAFDMAKTALAKLKGGTDGRPPAAASPAADPAKPADSQPSKDGKPVAATDAKPAEKPAEDPDAQLPFAKHPRFREVIAERNTFNDQLKTATTELEALRPKAQGMDQLAGYLKTHEIDSDGFNLSMSALAAFAGDTPVKGIEVTLGILEQAAMTDPSAAWKLLEPMVEKIRAAAGEILPADLAKEVTDGVTTEERALEIARARAAEKARSDNAKRHTERTARTTEQTQGEREQQRADLMVGSVHKWEQAWMAKDPDAAIVSPLVGGVILAKLQAHKGELTDALIASIADKAVEEVKVHLRKANPNPAKPKTALPEGGPGKSKAEPADSYDAATQAYRRLQSGEVKLSA